MRLVRVLGYPAFEIVIEQLGIDDCAVMKVHMMGSLGHANYLEVCGNEFTPDEPHLAEELWETLGHTGGIVAAGWPDFDEAVAKAEEVVVPVQVNGKVRARLNVPADTREERLRELALADPQVMKYLEGKTVRKVVMAGGKLVSIVVS